LPWGVGRSEFFESAEGCFDEGFMAEEAIQNLLGLSKMS
jgi:hypothetical protein